MKIKLEKKPSGVEQIFLEELGTISSDKQGNYLDIEVENYRIYRNLNAYYLNGVKILDNYSFHFKVHPQAICNAIAQKPVYTTDIDHRFREENVRYKKELNDYSYISILKRQYDFCCSPQVTGGWGMDGEPDHTAKNEYRKLWAMRGPSQTLFDKCIRGNNHNIVWAGGEPARPIKRDIIAIPEAVVPQKIIDKLIALLEKHITKLDSTSGWIIAKSATKRSKLVELQTTLKSGTFSSIDKLSEAINFWSDNNQPIIDKPRNRFRIFGYGGPTETRGIVTDIQQTLRRQVK